MPSKQSTNTKISDPLHDLIHSMSRTEKRYFNVNTQSIKNNKGEVPDYYILFEILDKMKVYDKDKAENKLLQKVGKDGFSNFTVKKKELYDVLMKSLRNYGYERMKKSADYIKVLIRDANFLFKRGLFKDAEKHLQEAKKLAQKCGDTLSLIEINRFEGEYSLITRDKNLDKKLEKIHIEKKYYLEKLAEEEQIRIDLELISSKRLKVARLTRENDINEFKSRFSHLFKIERKKDLSILAQRYLMNTIGTYHYLLGENQSFLEKGLMMNVWWEQNKLWLNQSPHFYISSLSNSLFAYGRLGQYDQYLKILKKIEDITPNNQYEESMRFHRLMINQQVYFLNKGLIDQVCNLSIAIKKGIKKHKLNEGVQIVLIFNVIVAFFVTKRYKECLEWIKLYDPFKKMDLAKVQIQIAQLLKIIALYDLEDIDELEKGIKQTEKYFQHELNLSIHSFENVILRAVKRMGNVVPIEQKKIIIELKETMNQLPLKTKRRLGFDEIDLWIDSKIQRKTITQLLEERNKGKT